MQVDHLSGSKVTACEGNIDLIYYFSLWSQEKFISPLREVQNMLSLKHQAEGITDLVYMCIAIVTLYYYFCDASLEKIPLNAVLSILINSFMPMDESSVYFVYMGYIKC